MSDVHEAATKGAETLCRKLHEEQKNYGKDVKFNPALVALFFHAAIEDHLREQGYTGLVEAAERIDRCCDLCHKCQLNLREALARVNRPDERLATGHVKGGANE